MTGQVWAACRGSDAVAPFGGQGGLIDPSRKIWVSSPSSWLPAALAPGQVSDDLNPRRTALVVSEVLEDEKEQPH